MERDRLLTPKEVSVWIGFSITKLSELRTAGHGPDFLQLSPRKCRYREQDVQAWLDANVKRTADSRISA